MRFLKSLKYAFRGIIYCINNERNMRIHTAAALYVFAFSFFFEMSRERYALLFLTFAMVMMGELMNTVAEELSDMTAASFNPVVRIVKDMAAGAVLVCAVFAIGVGLCLFWQPAAFLRILCFFQERPARILALSVSLAAAYLYICAGPLGIRDFIQRRKRGVKSRGGKKTGK